MALRYARARSCEGQPRFVRLLVTADEFGDAQQAYAIKSQCIRHSSSKQVAKGIPETRGAQQITFSACPRKRGKDKKPRCIFGTEPCIIRGKEQECVFANSNEQARKKGFRAYCSQRALYLAGFHDILPHRSCKI